MEREPVSLAILDIMLPEMDGFTSAAKYGRSICFDGAYLQAAQAELWEAARGRIEVAETDCTEVGFAEKSKAAAWTECDKHEFVGEHIWKYIM